MKAFCSAFFDSVSCQRIAGVSDRHVQLKADELEVAKRLPHAGCESVLDSGRLDAQSLKGMMRPDDAERRVAAGADEVIRFNRGGRQSSNPRPTPIFRGHAFHRFAIPVCAPSAFRQPESRLYSFMAWPIASVFLPRSF